MLYASFSRAFHARHSSHLANFQAWTDAKSPSIWTWAEPPQQVTTSGFVTDEEYVAAEKAHKERKADALATEKLAEVQRRAYENLKNLAAQTFQFRSKLVNGVEFVKTVWAEGYSQLRSQKRGACSTFFPEAPDRGSYVVHGASLHYARSLVAKAAMLAPA